MDGLLYGYDLILSARSFKVVAVAHATRGQERPAHVGRRAVPGRAASPYSRASRSRIRRSAGIAQAGPEPVRNAGRTPRADFPHGSAALRCIGRSDTEAGAMSPLHLARAKPARHALGTEPSPAPPRSAGGNAPPIIPSGPCFCTAPPPTRPLERLVWPKPARLPATAAGDFFPPPAMPALHREAKKPPAAASHFVPPFGCGPVVPRPIDSHRGRDRRGPEARKD